MQWNLDWVMCLFVFDFDVAGAHNSLFFVFCFDFEEGL